MRLKHFCETRNMTPKQMWMKAFRRVRMKMFYDQHFGGKLEAVRERAHQKRRDAAAIGETADLTLDERNALETEYDEVKDSLKVPVVDKIAEIARKVGVEEKRENRWDEPEGLKCAVESVEEYLKRRAQDREREMLASEVELKEKTVKQAAEKVDQFLANYDLQKSLLGGMEEGGAGKRGEWDASTRARIESVLLERQKRLDAEQKAAEARMGRGFLGGGEMLLPEVGTAEYERMKQDEAR